jgi:hypothetical protein
LAAAPREQLFPVEGAEPIQIIKRDGAASLPVLRLLDEVPQMAVGAVEEESRVLYRNVLLRSDARQPELILGRDCIGHIKPFLSLGFQLPLNPLSDLITLIFGSMMNC